MAVQGSHTFAAIDAGGGHTCGVTTAEEAFCWGSNDFGQLGDGNPMSSDVPVAVQGVHAFAAISTGGFHTCGVTTTGDAFCWGRNPRGQLGDGHAGTDRDTPVEVVSP